MAVMSLRNVPDDLQRRVKATAASEGLTLREFVLGMLERDMKRGGWTAAPEKRELGKTALPAVPETSVLPASPPQPAPVVRQGEPPCKADGHTGRWLPDGGYWCFTCGRSYRAIK
jgi:hypothetical protein